MNIGNKLIALRAERKMSQSELADLLDVSRQTVSKWECNICDPEIGRITQMALIFNVTTDYLLDNEVDNCVVKKNVTDNKNKFKLKKSSKQILICFIPTILFIIFTYVYCYIIAPVSYNPIDGAYQTGLMAYILNPQELGYTGILLIATGALLIIASIVFTIYKTNKKENKKT